MQLLPMASSPDGLISAPYAVITKTPGWEVLHNQQRECHTMPWWGGGIRYNRFGLQLKLGHTPALHRDSMTGVHELMCAS